MSRIAIAVENLALRQQLAVLNRKVHRPQLHRRDRFFWMILSQLWKNWREVLIIVKSSPTNRSPHSGSTISSARSSVGHPNRLGMYSTLYPLQICVPVAETMIKSVVLDHLSAPNLMSGQIVQSRMLLAHLNYSLYYSLYIC